MASTKEDWSDNIKYCSQFQEYSEVTFDHERFLPNTQYLFIQKASDLENHAEFDLLKGHSLVGSDPNEITNV